MNPKLNFPTQAEARACQIGIEHVNDSAIKATALRPEPDGSWSVLIDDEDDPPSDEDDPQHCNDPRGHKFTSTVYRGLGLSFCERCGLNGDA